MDSIYYKKTSAPEKPEKTKEEQINLEKTRMPTPIFPRQQSNIASGIPEQLPNSENIDD